MSPSNDERKWVYMASLKWASQMSLHGCPHMTEMKVQGRCKQMSYMNMHMAHPGSQHIIFDTGLCAHMRPNTKWTKQISLHQHPQNDPPEWVYKAAWTHLHGYPQMNHPDEFTWKITLPNKFTWAPSHDMTQPNAIEWVYMGSLTRHDPTCLNKFTWETIHVYMGAHTWPNEGTRESRENQPYKHA